MRAKRRHERFIKRFETEFASGDKTIKGVSSDFSSSGLFIRTNRPFVSGTVVDIVIHISEDVTSRLKGRVMRATNSPVPSMKNGMGIELLESDRQYNLLIKSFLPEVKPEPPVNEYKPTGPSPEGKYQQTTDAGQAAEKGGAEETAPEFFIIACPSCRIKNKVPGAKMSLGPKCGKCGALLNPA